MKLLWLLICVKSCMGQVDVKSTLFDTFPKNNSRYIPTASRFVWLNDDNMDLVLVDLKQDITKKVMRSRPGVWNTYTLFTKYDRLKGKLILYGDTKAIHSSTYNNRFPLAVLVHDWNSNSKSYSMAIILDALTSTDCNIILVDWSFVAKKNYAHAVYLVPEIGKHVGKFVDWFLQEGGDDWSKVHLIGFGMGAHIVGNAGRSLGGRPSRITGLDPLGPLFDDNNDALSLNDANHVEVFHTDFRVTGFSKVIGHIDFFPNGGQNQTLCVGEKAHACSHLKACEYFAATIYGHKIKARKCLNLRVALKKQCSGDEYLMGTNKFPKTQSGIYGALVLFRLNS